MDTTTDYYKALRKPLPVYVREATSADDMLIREREGLKLHNRLGIYYYGDIYQDYYILKNDEAGEEYPLCKDVFEALYEWVEPDAV